MLKFTANAERILFGTLVILGYNILASLVLSGWSAGKGVSDTMQGVVLGALGSGVIQILQSTFRTDRNDEAKTRNTGAAIDALARSTPVTPGAPLEVDATVHGPDDPPASTDPAT